MRRSLGEGEVRAIFGTLAGVDPGSAAAVDQPLHTVYGGAHLFAHDTASRLGALAGASLARYAPDAQTFARALGVQSDLAEGVYGRTKAKLSSSAVEDLRVDFEDGYGIRADDEEDRAAVHVADEMALGISRGTLPARVGIRVKAPSGPLGGRGARTLDLFLTRLVERAGQLPPRFVITLPKVSSPPQVAAFAALLRELEGALGLHEGDLRFELMIETIGALVDERGALAPRALVSAAAGRCVALHLGAYDLLAEAGVAARHQSMRHPLCDFARQILLTCGIPARVALSDGATNLMPIGPYRGDPSSLSPQQESENQRVVHEAWRTHHDHVYRALQMGLYQGWDLHPAQIPARYAAVYRFFLEDMSASIERLSNFVARATKATLSGAVFDDAATGQGLLNFFVRALAAGAIDESALPALGLTREEIEGRSFAAIVANREGRTP